jgi:hypothetical protein
LSISGVVLGSILIACGKSREVLGMRDGPSETARDSAGIRIIQYGHWPAEPVWATLEEEPIYEIGWSMDGHVFEHVVSGDLFPDGRALVADGGGTLEVVLISEVGDVETVLGKPGEGPGEFGDIQAVSHMDSTTVVVEDPKSGRLSLFHDGELASEFRIDRLANLTLLGADVNGRLLMGPPLYAVVGRRYPTPWLSVPLVTVDPTTETVDTVGAADWDQSILFGGNNPFRSEGFAARVPSGFVVGRGDRAELQWADSDGRLTQIMRWDAPRVPPSDEIWNAYVEGFSAAARQRGVATEGSVGINARIEAMRDAAREPLPVFGRIETDPEGNLWIGAYVPRFSPHEETQQRFDVVDVHGAWLGVVYLPPPAHFTLLAIGRDRVLGVSRNNLDVEAVVAYRYSP